MLKGSFVNDTDTLTIFFMDLGYVTLDFIFQSDNVYCPIILFAGASIELLTVVSLFPDPSKYK